MSEVLTFDITKHHGTYEAHKEMGYGWRLILTADSKFTMIKFDGNLHDPEGTAHDAQGTWTSNRVSRSRGGNK